jgi:hypothetical protein
MMERRLVATSLVTLVVGFSAGFVLRPAIYPDAPTAAVVAPAPSLAAPRATQYFAANLDEARRIVAGCRNGSVRGDECANAEQAISTAEGRERTKRFLGK